VFKGSKRFDTLLGTMNDIKPGHDVRRKTGGRTMLVEDVRERSAGGRIAVCSWLDEGDPEPKHDTIPVASLIRVRSSKGRKRPKR
jgi:hypothetical protein